MNQKIFSGKAISTLAQSQWKFDLAQYSSASESRGRYFLFENSQFFNEAKISQAFCEYSYNHHD